VVWERDGSVHELKVVVKQGSGLELTDPKIINDAGMIALEGFLSNGDSHCVVLIPCEPGEEGCVDSRERTTSEARHSSAAITNSPLASARGQVTSRGNISAWRARMGLQFHLPGPGLATEKN
jgi:hypothetical protein